MFEYPISILIAFAVFLWVAIYFIYLSCKLLNLYVFDGADSRTPYLLSAILIFLLNLVFTIMGFIGKELYTVTPFITLFSFISIAYVLLKSRLSGYITVHLNIITKQTSIIIATIIYFMFFSYTVFYINSYIIRYEYLIESVDKTNLFTFLGSMYIYASVYQTSHAVVTLVVGLFFSIFIYVFDKIEKRSKYLLFRDKLLIISMILVFLLKLYFQDSIIWIYISGVNILLIYFIFIIIFSKEAYSIFHHAKAVNVKHGPVDELINKLAAKYKKNKKFSKKDEEKIIYVSNIIKEDKLLEEMVYSQQLLFQPNKRRVLKIIRKIITDRGHII